MTPHRPTGESESVKDKRSKALELRIAGGSYRAIAREMQTSQQSAFRWVQDALAELDAVTKQRAERLRDLELQRCDKLTLALWPKAKLGDAKAVTALMRVMDRRAKLTGIDEPEKHELSGGPLAFVMATANDALASKLARLADAGAAGRVPVESDAGGSGAAAL